MNYVGRNADDFFRSVVELGEKTRRRFKLDGALPDEIHEAPTQEAAYVCLHCDGDTELIIREDLVQLPRPATVAVYGCKTCGDFTLWRGYAT